MTDPPPVMQDGAAVTIQGAALPMMYRATLALAARHRRDGRRRHRCCTRSVSRCTARTWRRDRDTEDAAHPGRPAGIRTVRTAT